MQGWGKRFAGAMLVASAAVCGAQTLGGNALQGKTIFDARCGACHSVDSNRVGPALGGVVGRVAGKAPDFFYSQALGAAKHVWTREKLLAWLTDPEALVPGQAMGYRLETAQDRQDVVAYLATQKP
jgi:cytochrome c